MYRDNKQTLQEITNIYYKIQCQSTIL